MYSMKDSVTSTETCSKSGKNGLSKLINIKLLKHSLCVCVRARSRSGRGKSPEELLCQCSSEAQWKKPHHDDAGN